MPTLRWLERLFRLEERGSSIAIELRAGLVTFLTLSYILVVNPQILSQAGMPAADVAAATAIASAIACLVMGLYANFPFALAPGMGLNAYFTFGVVQAMGVDWRVALAAVFAAGVLFVLLAATGARQALIEAVPVPLQLAAMSGIGLFLALIGLENAGLVVAHPETLVSLGELRRPEPLLALAGLLLTGALLARRWRGAMLVGVLAVAAAAWGLGLAPLPERWLALPALPRETLMALDLRGLLDLSLAPVVFAFFFVAVFDTAGTLLGIGRLGGFVDERGRMPGARQAFLADATGSAIGALLGTSTVTAYIESATGIEEGGRTGLTAVVVGALLLLALVFAPALAAVPAVATAPALVVVGALMMRGVAAVPWDRPADAVPAFLTLAAMPLTFSIANGLALGIVSWVALRLAAGRWREVNPLLAGVAALVVAFYAVS